MNWSAFMGIASTFALLLPPALILIFKLYTNRSLQALFTYYLLSAVYNLMVQGVIPVNVDTRRIFGTINNYLDAPMMLMFLLFFCVERWKSKAILLSLFIFFAYELVICLFYGFTRETNVYVLGPGIVLILVFSLLLFMRHIKITIVQNRGLGKTIMLASVVFSYGCFAIIYLLHYVQKTTAVNDIFLLYFITSLVTSLLMAGGVLLINQHLKTLKELQHTRKELQVFFNN
jgi:hypothetical protein